MVNPPTTWSLCLLSWRESNLKQVQSLKATYKQDEKTLCGFKAYIRAEPPNSILDQFKGNIIFPDSSGNLTVKPVTDPSVIPLDNKAILLRVCRGQQDSFPLFCLFWSTNKPVWIFCAQQSNSWFFGRGRLFWLDVVLISDDHRVSQFVIQSLRMQLLFMQEKEQN